VAKKRGILVPSLVADAGSTTARGRDRTLSAEPDASLEEAAAHGHEVLGGAPDALACPCATSRSPRDLPDARAPARPQP
jgi:hypothetical protein